MESILSVTTPASDRTLLSISELRAAVGLNTTDKSQDPALTTLGQRVAGRIAWVCGIAADGAEPLTLREEGLTETFRFDPRYRRDWSSRPEELSLARRPVTALASVIEDGSTLDATDYELLGAAGMLRRLSSDSVSRWYGSKVIVTYTAGWATVPDGLKYAAEQLARNYWFQNSRDPAVKQIAVPGIIEKQFWVSAGSDPDIPQDVMDALGPFLSSKR